jgi:hypothetical protein
LHFGGTRLKPAGQIACHAPRAACQPGYLSRYGSRGNEVFLNGSPFFVSIHGEGDMWFTIGAVLAAIPVGYGLGLLAAWLLAGFNFGQLPLITVPLGIVASIVFALVPYVQARTRFAVMIGALIMVFITLFFIKPPM